MRTNSDIKDLAATLRSMVEHETSQIDRRLTWLAQLEGLLFAALGFAWDKGTSLIDILSLIGIVIALLVCSLVVLSMVACERIRKCWLKHKPTDYDGPDIFGYYPHHAPARVYIAAEVIIPIVIAAGWVAVVIVKLKESAAP